MVSEVKFTHLQQYTNHGHSKAKQANKIKSSKKPLLEVQRKGGKYKSQEKTRKAGTGGPQKRSLRRLGQQEYRSAISSVDNIKSWISKDVNPENDCILLCGDESSFSSEHVKSWVVEEAMTRYQEDNDFLLCS